MRELGSKYFWNACTFTRVLSEPEESSRGLAVLAAGQGEVLRTCYAVVEAGWYQGRDACRAIYVFLKGFRHYLVSQV